MKEKKLVEKIKMLKEAQMAEYFYSNGVTVQRVNNLSLEDESLRWTAKKALKRIDASLSKEMQMFYFFLPTGKLTSFSNDGPRYMEDGYFKKEKQYQIASWLGIFFYILVIVSLAAYFK